MTAKQQLDLDRLERASKFGKENITFFLPKPPERGPSQGQQILTELDTLIVRISSAHIIQLSGSVGAETEDKGLLRERLEESLRTINKAVTYIAEERKTPALKSHFRLPRNHNDKTLTARASAFCDAIEELHLEAGLIALDHAPDFLKKLRTLILDFKAAEEEQKGALQDQAGATAVFAPLIARGKVLVKGLDAIIQNKFKGDAAKLGAWRSAIHAEHTPRRAKTLAPGATAAVLSATGGPSVN